MEDIGLVVVVEEEEFYERIEAPKFVDFTIPDRSRPDRRSWFCARIGCDQNHEEVDPDELKRSFMLRVMAARSPNVRFQRALNKKGSRANTKCPQSAPAKSTKNGISRISTMNSITEKISTAKLKQHPITSLRETPIQKKAKVHTFTSEKEQTTTGNNKSQAKYLKTPATVVASKDRNLVKALFLHTPKKTSGSTKAQLSEICSEMKKKLNIDGERKRITRGSYAKRSNKCNGSSISSKKTSAVGSKNCSHNILKEAAHNEMKDAEIGVGSNGSGHVEENNTTLAKSTGEEHQATIDSKIESDSEESIKPSKDEVKYLNLHVSSGVGSEIKTACNVTNDDDKENTLFPFENRSMCPNVASSETKSLHFKNPTPELNLNKEAKVQNKAFQGVKLKRTTNPKPFRLRTDERGILKEANLERRLQVEAKKEPTSLLSHVDGIQIQETSSRAKLIRCPENKHAKSNFQTHKLNSKKEKVIRGSHSKSFKIASPKKLLRITSAAKARRESISRLFKGKGGLINLPERTTERNAGCLQWRKPATIPKEPKFHRIHVPKSCIRRSEMAVL